MFHLTAGPTQIKMKTNPVVEAYASQFKATSRQALTTAGKNAYQLGLAGQIISLQFAGEALVGAILPALSHLLIETTAAADLTILLWDSASTGIDPPELPWQPPVNEAWKIETEAYLASFHPQRASQIWFDRREHQAYYWIPEAISALAEESYSPLISLWSWWFTSQSTQLIHAAAIGGKNSAALLVGSSGSGKSTTSLLALNSPLRYLSDDYCLVSFQPQPIVYSLFATAKVLLPDKARHPWLSPAYQRENTVKALYVVYPHFASHLALKMPLKAILAPRVTHQARTRLVPVSAMEALRALAPSTLMQLHVGVDSAGALRQLANLVRQLPCYRLLLGTDFENIPAVLAELLDA